MTRSCLVWVVVACSFGMVACSDGDASGRYTPEAPTTDVPPSGGPPIYLRLRNETGLSFDSITVGANEELDYGALPDDSVSVYLPAEIMYRTARMVGSSGEVEVIHQPTDFVGETPLPSGYYTYVLSLARPDWFEIAVHRDPAPN